MEKQKQKNLPLIYSCSGCSNVAQLANDIAVKMNYDGIAEMSCIAGVGGKVKSLVKTAKSNRPIIVIDGCPLQCAKECLKNIDIEPNEHIILTDYDLKKRYNTRLNLEDEMDVFEQIVTKTKEMHSNGL
ncbi:putative zinc-binding protein [Gelidibacter japonicus]|uniref:putative zinc-binding protein n=1 Tax=Gelidibacter japonicus TaxID=1962232 RepID=UPI002AFE4FDD|nr:putative zinc-binding protein [Gelidibacter japonicus]